MGCRATGQDALEIKRLLPGISKVIVAAVLFGEWPFFRVCLLRFVRLAPVPAALDRQGSVSSGAQQHLRRRRFDRQEHEGCGGVDQRRAAAGTYVGGNEAAGVMAVSV